MTPSFDEVIDQFASKRVLVIGEAMLDTYFVGTSTRLCQEAPVPVVAVQDRQDYPGGAANTAVNLAALGCQVELLSVVGDDDEGARLLQLLRQHNIGLDLCQVVAGRQTLAKQRVVSDDELIVRFDRGDTSPLSPELERHLRDGLGAAFMRADAVVISDYQYGTVSDGLLATLRPLQQRFRQCIAVDARDLTRYRSLGVTLVKPNYAEALKLCGSNLERLKPMTPPVRVAVATQFAERVLERTGARIVAITLDADGAIVAERGQPLHRTTTTPADQAQTAGAGDTYLAAFTLALVSGAPTGNAGEIAAWAAGVVVRRAGTTACTLEELRQAPQETTHHQVTVLTEWRLRTSGNGFMTDALPDEPYPAASIRGSRPRSGQPDDDPSADCADVVNSEAPALHPA